jgi:hypothetical protein
MRLVRRVADPPAHAGSWILAPGSFLSAFCPKRATPDQTGDPSWSFLFIVILENWNLAGLPRNITGDRLGITAANTKTGFIRGEVRMYIALRDRQS